MSEAKRELKKVSVEEINLSKQKAGFVLEGKLVGAKEKTFTDEEGEEKKFHTMFVENSNGDRIKFLADSGLRTGLEDAMIVEGDWFRAIKGEKRDIGRGRTQNTWEIYR